MSSHPIAKSGHPRQVRLPCLRCERRRERPSDTRKQPDLRTGSVKTDAGMRVGERTRGGATRDTNIVNRKK